MKIPVRCGKCREIFMDESEDPQLEFDFYEQKITFICKNSKCKHENVMDFAVWQKKQEHSPLPRMGTM